MITAAEARALAGVPDSEYVEAAVARLLDAVKAAAPKGKRALRTGWEHKEDRDLWIEGGYSRTSNWKSAVSMLEKLGFKVRFYYQEGQFVDEYTLVEW